MLNHIALRKVKMVYSFDLPECNRVKSLQKKKKQQKNNECNMESRMGVAKIDVTLCYLNCLMKLDIVPACYWFPVVKNKLG